MAESCQYCGEELLGQVNRCWRCGKTQQAAAPHTQPPVRSATPPVRSATADQVVVAELVDANLPPPPATADTPVAGRPASTAATPFRPPQASRPANGTAPSPGSSPPPPVYPRHAAAVGGAVAAPLLAVLAILISFWSAAAAALPALIGLGMGVWGLLSSRRRWALAGLLLCLLVLLYAAAQLLVLAYRWWTGA